METDIGQFGPIDRGWAIFSPEGKLILVEYAKQAAKADQQQLEYVQQMVY